jgi:hypothetical protein
MHDAGKAPFDMSVDELRVNLARLETETAGNAEPVTTQTPQEMVEEYHRLMKAVRSDDPDIALEAAKTLLDRAGYVPWSRFAPLDMSDPEFALTCVKAELRLRDEPASAPTSYAEFETMTLEELEAVRARLQAELAARGEAVD